jgi:hypothetical protein
MTGEGPYDTNTLETPDEARARVEEILATDTQAADWVENAKDSKTPIDDR